MNDQLYCATFITKPACRDQKTLRPLKRERERDREKELETEAWTSNERERDRERERERERETVWEKDLQTETRGQIFSTSRSCVGLSEHKSKQVSSDEGKKPKR